MNGHKEWTITEDLPESFVVWLKDRITEQWLKQKKGILQIAGEIGVSPALLSRWIGGKGPLTQKDIHLLADHFDWGIYTLLGVNRPNNQQEQ